MQHNEWTSEELRKHAKKYKTRGAWLIGHPNSYQASSNRGKAFHNKSCSHMTWSSYFKNPPPKRWGYWTKERVLREGLKHKTRAKWREKSMSSYLTAYRTGWIRFLGAHGLANNRNRGKRYWSVKRLASHVERSPQINSKEAWKALHPASYKAAAKRRLISALLEGRAV